ncbi:hypothetical protein CapIbe_000875 [Capra ibex]
MLEAEVIPWILVTWLESLHTWKPAHSFPESQEKIYQTFQLIKLPVEEWNKCSRCNVPLDKMFNSNPSEMI